MLKLYSTIKWRYWRASWLYHWILCKHRNAIERADYGSRWKAERWTVGDLYGSWTCEQKRPTPTNKTRNKAVL